MIRSTRLLLYFFIGFLLACNVVFAYAETKPAVETSTTPATLGPPYQTNGGNTNAVNPTEACKTRYSGYIGASRVDTSPASGSYTAYRCLYNDNSLGEWIYASRSCPGGRASGTNANYCIMQTCDDSSWTLADGVCTRAECVPPQVRQADGTCGAPPDACLSRSGSSYAWISSPVGSPTPDGQTYCDSGCTVGLNPAATGTAYTNGKDKIQRYEISQLAYKCADGLSNTPISIEPAKQPPETPKKPPCAPTEGVLTTSSGTVACVPPGVDSNKPDVTTKKTTKSYPDGSQIIETETTTKDPGTGAKSVDVGTQTTPKTGGGPGEAGEPSDTKKPTTDEKCEGPDCPEEAKKGTFVERGKLYDKKYENGPSGVMTEKFTALKSSPIFSLVSNLAPSGVVDSGSCPSWDMSFNYGPRMNFGSARLEPPCFIWGALRAIFMIMSLILARRLVFGG